MKSYIDRVLYVVTEVGFILKMMGNDREGFITELTRQDFITELTRPDHPYLHSILITMGRVD